MPKDLEPRPRVTPRSVASVAPHIALPVGSGNVGPAVGPAVGGSGGAGVAGAHGTPRAWRANGPGRFEGSEIYAGAAVGAHDGSGHTQSQAGVVDGKMGIGRKEWQLERPSFREGGSRIYR